MLELFTFIVGFTYAIALIAVSDLGRDYKPIPYKGKWYCKVEKC